MKYLAFLFSVLPLPALAHDLTVDHSLAADYLAPALAGALAFVSPGLAVRRLARIRA